MFVTGFMSPYNHQNVELLDPWEQNNIVSSYMDQLRPPERPELEERPMNGDLSIIHNQAGVHNKALPLQNTFCNLMKGHFHITNIVIVNGYF